MSCNNKHNIIVNVVCSFRQSPTEESTVPRAPSSSVAKTHDFPLQRVLFDETINQQLIPSAEGFPLVRFRHNSSQNDGRVQNGRQRQTELVSSLRPGQTVWGVWWGIGKRSELNREWGWGEDKLVGFLGKCWRVDIHAICAAGQNNNIYFSTSNPANLSCRQHTKAFHVFSLHNLYFITIFWLQIYFTTLLASTLHIQFKRPLVFSSRFSAG